MKDVMFCPGYLTFRPSVSTQCAAVRCHSLLCFYLFWFSLATGDAAFLLLEPATTSLYQKWIMHTHTYTHTQIHYKMTDCSPDRFLDALITTRLIYWVTDWQMFGRPAVSASVCFIHWNILIGQWAVQHEALMLLIAKYRATSVRVNVTSRVAIQIYWRFRDAWQLSVCECSTVSIF
jgi:hypothetical protein